MNIEKLQKLKTQIQKDARLFVQDAWLSRVNDGEFCGTAGCLAGHACFMEGLVQAKMCDGLRSYHAVTDGVNHFYVRDRAASILGLTECEADALFDCYVDGWGAAARKMFLHATNKSEKVAAAVAELDRLIAIAKEQE